MSFDTLGSGLQRPLASFLTVTASYPAFSTRLRNTNCESVSADGLLTL